MPRGPAAGVKKVGRGPKAHKLAEEFPTGTILQDLCKKQYRLSSVIGQGGFGLIYLASEETTKQVDKKSANYVVKIEPKDNGPLYCEMQFYQRVAKAYLIQSFVTSHKLKYLGVPPYIGTGRHVFNGSEFRFLVMPQFGTDLQKYLVKNKGQFSPKTTFGIGLRMLDALQFLHENEYVHADVKAANILTGFRSGSEVMNEVYLVDYGLAYRYTVDGVHKEYKEDPRKAHDGTIEFTSRDAHKGVSPSRRADLEILGYCMLQWLSGKLPWEDRLSDPRYVADKKERLTSNPHILISACLPGPKTPSSECMCKFMEKVNALKYDSTPDYKGFRDLLLTAAQKDGLRDEWKLELGTPAEARKAKVRADVAGEISELAGMATSAAGGDELGGLSEPGGIPVEQAANAELCQRRSSLMVVGGQVGWLEQLLVQTVHQLGTDTLGQHRGQLIQVLMPLVVLLSGLVLASLMAVPFFTQPASPPSSLEERLRTLEQLNVVRLFEEEDTNM